MVKPQGAVEKSSAHGIKDIGSEHQKTENSGKILTDVVQKTRNDSVRENVKEAFFTQITGPIIGRKESPFVRNRPVFTAESIYSINNNKKNKDKSSWEILLDFIPKYVKNGTVVGFMNKLRFQNNFTKKKSNINRRMNRAAIKRLKKEDVYKDGEVINNQAQLGDLSFGPMFLTDMSKSGCEIIATYNMMIKLGEKLTGSDLIKMISEFEMDGAMLEGVFGVAPTAIQDYLIEKYENDENISISMLIPGKETTNDDIDKIGEDNDVFIATVYNNKESMKAQIHTVCISKEKDGSYTIYNAYYKDENKNYAAKKGYTSLSDAVQNISQNPKLISLISADDKER